MDHVCTREAAPVPLKTCLSTADVGEREEAALGALMESRGGAVEPQRWIAT